MPKQKAAQTEKQAPEPKKLTKLAEQALKIAELEARIEKLEKYQRVVTDGYQFAADQIRPLYGFGAVALVFDAIYKKLGE